MQPGVEAPQGSLDLGHHSGAARLHAGLFAGLRCFWGGPRCRRAPGTRRRREDRRLRVAVPVVTREEMDGDGAGGRGSHLGPGNLPTIHRRGACDNPY